MGEVAEEVTQLCQGEGLPSAKLKHRVRAKSNSPMEQTARRATPCPPQLIGIPLGTRTSTCAPVEMEMDGDEECEF
jgi:hypothetical protein